VVAYQNPKGGREGFFKGSARRFINCVRGASMTLHITIITDRYLVTVCDRMISAAGRTLDDDAHKQHHLSTSDGRMIIGFAGIAGPLGDESRTLNFVGNVINDVSRKGGHFASDYVSAIGIRVDNYARQYRGRHIDDHRLVVMVNGVLNTNCWGPTFFSRIIDNCLNNRGSFESKPRTKFKAREKFHTDIKPGSNVIYFVGDDVGAVKQVKLLARISADADAGNPDAIFEKSAYLIRAVAKHSQGRVGRNCTGAILDKVTGDVRIVDKREWRTHQIKIPPVSVSTPAGSFTISNFVGNFY